MSEEITVTLEAPEPEIVAIPTPDPDIADEPAIVAAIAERMEQIEDNRLFQENLKKLEIAFAEMRAVIDAERAEQREFNAMVQSFIDALETPEPEPEPLTEENIEPIAEVEIIPAEPTEAEEKESEPVKRNRYFI